MGIGEDYALRAEIPNPCDAILADCGEQLAVPIERHTIDRACHVKRVDAPFGDRIPHDGLPIRAASGETEPGKVEIDVGDRARMRGQSVRNNAGARIPESHCAIKVRRGDLIAGRIIGKPDRVAERRGRSTKRPACAAVPHLDRPPIGASYKILAIGAEGDGRIGLVTGQGGRDRRGQKGPAQDIFRRGGLPR